MNLRKAALFACVLAGSRAGLLAQGTVARSLAWPTQKTAASVSKSGGVAPAKAPQVADPASLVFPHAAIDMERGGLPVFHEVLPLAGSTRAITVALRDARYEPLTPEERKAWPAALEAPSEPVVTSHVSLQRKQPHAIITVDPFRKNANTGLVEKLVDFKLDIAGSVNRGGGEQPKAYPANSRMQSGSWYRFTVAKDGVYKLTYEFLRDMGVDVNGLSSDRINIYGNHFGLLPFVNNVERPTDLIPNNIEVMDGGDGTFGPGDHILFYASGAMRWNLADTLFAHTKNVYTDSASYFVGIDVDAPFRIPALNSPNDLPTHTVTSFRDRQVIDRDLVNLIKSGRTWYGEVFDITTTYTYNFETPFLVNTEPIVLEVDGAARTFNSGAVTNSSTFTVNSGNSFSGTISVPGVTNSYTGPQGRNFHQDLTWNAGGNNVPVTVTFNKFDPVTSVAWMNFLRLNCTRELRMTGDQLIFRDLRSVGQGNIADFVLEQASTVQRVWDITDPTRVGSLEYSRNGSQLTFRAATDTLRQFIAFKDANYLVPTRVGRVNNQNLHATELPTDLVIVCPPEFTGPAQQLAERRMSEGLVVRIVTPQQVFNEFSSGARDATAIKRYMRMLYDKAGSDPLLLPRYLLLFGDGSFNNISLASTNQNFIPTYQTEDGIDPSRSYTSDDYFGLLDANEGEYTGDLVDIGIGRLVAHNLQQAQEIVSKLLNYDGLRILSSSGGNCSATADGGIADWRTHVLFVSDDQEGDGFEGVIHMDQSDFLARRVESEHPYLNVDKMYMDAYQQLTTPGGERYPDAINALREKVQKGLLLVNYVGHGGEVGWAHERLLDNTTILDWSNKDRLPLFMTATCEFSRWDDPARTSAGEYVLLNPNGGGIGLMTTTRLAYSSQNFALAQDFYDFVFSDTEEQGRANRLGDIYRRTKMAISAQQPTLRNHRNFSLLGDPSMQLGIPKERLRVSAVTDTLGNAVDTLKALSTVRISGFVDDGTGQPKTDFNGVVIPIVYDKVQEQNTLANDGGSPFVFDLRKSIIYRGKATVTAGVFSFTFVVPKDINYQVGTGRVSFYAESSTTNGCGHDNDILVGGTATNVPLDEQGPQIELYLNDDRFVRGGITTPNPLLFAKLFDDNGINTVGSSIGHDLLATLDENTEQAVVLNDLYEADQDTYKSGEVRYRFNNLSEGSHTLRLKAWDVHNNSSESTTDFVVAPSAELALEHVLNYPNPFTTYTEFFFEHNRPCVTLEVQVQVFTVAGRLVKTLNRRLNCDGFRTEPMAWNGLDDFGDKLGRGTYVYRVRVATPDGEEAEKFEKLVILR